MNVAKFILELQKLPADALVLYRAYSTLLDLEPEELELVTPDANLPLIRYGPNNQVMEGSRAWLVGQDPQPVFLTALVLPGN